MIFDPPDNLHLGGILVTKLADTLPTGCQIYMDLYFTSIAIVESLLKRFIYAIGTLMNCYIQNFKN